MAWTPKTARALDTDAATTGGWQPKTARSLDDGASQNMRAAEAITVASMRARDPQAAPGFKWDDAGNEVGQARQQPSSLKEDAIAGLLAAGKSASLGQAPRALAAVDAVRSVTGMPERPIESLADVGAKIGDLETASKVALAKLAMHPVDTAKQLKSAYDEQLPQYREGFAKQAEDHPVGSFVGEMAPMVLSAPKGLAQLAVTGALQAAGNSEADLEKIATGDLAEAGKLGAQTATGAGFGAAMGKFPKLASAGLIGTAAVGDKLGMSDADRLKMAAGGALGLVGGIKRTVGEGAANKSAAAMEEALVKPRAKAELAADRLQVAMERRGAESQRQVARVAGAREAEATAANKNYKAEIAEMLKAKRAASKQQAKLEAETNKLQQQLAELDAAEAKLPDRVAAKRAAEFGAVGGRIKSHRDLTGEELPEELRPLQEKIVGAFKERTPEVLGRDPDEAAAAFEAAEKADIAAKREAAMRALQKLTGGGDSGEGTMGGRPRNTGTRNAADDIDAEEAYKLALKHGLEPGDRSKFDPKARLPLAGKRPDESVFEVADPNGSTKGMYDVPADGKIQRLMRVEDRARKAANAAEEAATPEAQMKAGRDAILKKALIEKGLLEGPMSVLRGGPVGAVAREAYKNPAARAYLFDKVARVLTKGPELGRYAAFLQAQDLTDEERMARIEAVAKKVPEFAAALAD